MKLRQQLQKLGYSHSFTTEEKGAFNHRFHATFTVNLVVA